MNPTQFYHATLPPRVVSTEDELALLGPGWFDSPKKANLAAIEWPVEADDAPPKRGRRKRTETPDHPAEE
jgi:hypothetical protein